MNRAVKGFTIVELMLAMGFVASLLIAISVTTIQISNIYNRGVTLKDVNQSGVAIADELQRNIKESTSFSIKAGQGHYVNQGDDKGGRLCLGNYSYIWNYGTSLDNVNNLSNKYSEISQNYSNPIRIIKVADPDNSYCLDMSEPIYYDKTTELLNGGQHDLALHGFSISMSDSAVDFKTGQALYNISFIIGTNDKSAFIKDSATCLPPTAANSDPSYCYINDFNIVARSGNVIK